MTNWNWIWPKPNRLRKDCWRHRPSLWDFHDALIKADAYELFQSRRAGEGRALKL